MKSFKSLKFFAKKVLTNGFSSAILYLSKAKEVISDG